MRPARILVYTAMIVLLAASPLSAETIEVGDLTREYILHSPPGSGPWPLVVVLHGGNDRANRIRRRMGWDDLADQKGFAVVYPMGINRGWNDGRINTVRYDPGEAPDDVVFFDALLDVLIEQGVAAPSGVYITGPSNGGMMTMRLMCDRAERIAGVAPLIANLPVSLEPVCQPARAIPVMIINGRDDSLVPWDGGVVADNEERGSVLSTDETMEFWRKVNGCTDQTDRQDLADNAPDDDSTITRISWQACNAATELLQVNGGGHRVPGDDIQFGSRLVDALLGNQNEDVRAADAIWEFFSRSAETR
jgi:polyhydroxybutyrate depolymerase